MSKYKVSAIVAGYNVEEYIEECLDSLSSQTLRELEVIMIDDGSPDKTGEIMDRYSNKYENFKVVHQTNQGLSMVRNNGMDIAEGEFIAFVDGDDIVPENAYALMYSMLAETGSDMVSGGVNRTNGSKVTRSFLHKKAVKDTVRKTNIFNNPELIYDTTSWNKLYRKSLLLENHLSFPKSMLYEDMPLELSCHLLAKSVDIIEDCVYVWRRREGENTSITQQRSDMKNFLDRIKSIEMCFDAIDKYVTDEKKKQRIKRNLEFKVLDLDLMLYINAMNSYDQNYRKEVRTIILNLVNKFDPNIINLLVSSKKLKYSLLMDNELESLAKISNYRAITFRKEKPKKENGKLYQEYKFVTSNSGKPYKIEKTAFTFNNRMESIEVNEENHLIVKGHMYISQLDSKKSSNIKATISILNITNQRDITIPLECKLKSKHVTRKYGVKKSSINPLSRVYNYDYSGYSMKLSLSEAQHILGEGRWKFKINYFYEDIAVEGILGQPQKVKMPNYIFIDETNVLEFKANHDWELYIKSHEPNVLITDIISNDQNEVAFAMKTKETNHKYQIYFEEDETKDVWAKFSLMNKQLVLSKDILEKTNEKIINLYAFDTETYIKYSIYSSIQKKFVNTEEYDLIFGNQFNLMPKLYVTKNLVYIENVSLSSNQELLLTLKSNKNNLKDAVLEIRSNKNGKAHYFNGNYLNSYEASFTIPLTNQYSDFIFELGKSSFHVLIKGEKDYISTIPLFKQSEDEVTFFEKDHRIGRDSQVKFYLSQLNFPVMSAKLLWAKIDATPFRRKVTRKVIYPFLRLLPLSKKTMVFDSYWSTAFNCNPKAIYNYMKEHYPSYKLVWVFDNPNIQVDETAIKIRKNTFKYFYYLATAKYFIENTNMPNIFAKRKKQIDVQTLHGTMLKTMGLDEPQFKYGSKKKQNAFLARVANWDYLISSSDYQSEISKQAYLYKNQMLETGFPRNDVLYKQRDSKDEIKERLGIPKNKKVLLYAPTFRSRDSFNIHLDIEKMRESLSEEYVLITRFHYFVARSLNVPYNDKFVFDMSFYPAIEDLFIVTDILITDYSSLMFDFGHLRRPILFYAFDLEEYVNDIRGIYLNFEEMVPGPIVKDTDTLVEAIENIENLSKEYKDREINFYNKFCQFGRGGEATKKVVERILTEPTPEGKSVPLLRNELKRILRVNSWYRIIFNKVGRLSKKDIIIFESFLARRYSDSPKAIYEYVKKHYPQYKLYWNVNKENIDYFQKHKIPYIKRFSYSGIFKMARAKLWISNTRLPLWLEKPKGTLFVQTWHGTPLKTLGLDIETVTMGGKSRETYRKEVIKDTSKWDYLVSPNHYSTEIFKSAFAMQENQILETGYPRNDLLYNFTAEMQQSIKESLNIPNDRKVILYTPTWRDNEYTKYDEYSIKLQLDLELLREQFDQEIVILIRAHYLISENLDLSGYENFMIDVSDYEDISELYIISDCLITDYSSTFFDYANLRRPMIFFAYDLETYADEIRGFYFDFRLKAPGPIVETTDQLVNELKKVVSNSFSYNYDSFIEEFCHLEDGHSTERLVKEIFERKENNE